MSLHTIAGRHFVFAGGGYFRLFPYPLIRRWTEACGDYSISYIHPRDLDAGQPVVPGLSLVRRFKSYYGLGASEKKLGRYLKDFPFVDIGTADAGLDWGAAPVVNI